MEEYNLNEPLIDNKNDDDENQIFEKMNSKIRNDFIVKVYSILLVQILRTSIVVFFSYTSKSFNDFLYNNSFFYLVSLTILLTSIFIVLCNTQLLRTVPYNYIFLIAFTLAESYFLAAITCSYDKQTVLISLLFTFVMVLTLTIYAFKTETDITVYGGVLFCLLTLSILCGIILIFIRIDFLILVYNIIVLIIFAAYIVFDTQLMVGKNNGMKYSTDDYILASINLYLDIINLFIQLLSILNNRN